MVSRPPLAEQHEPPVEEVVPRQRTAPVELGTIRTDPPLLERPPGVRQRRAQTNDQELRRITGNSAYDGVARTPEDLRGSRWHGIKNHRPQG